MCLRLTVSRILKRPANTQARHLREVANARSSCFGRDFKSPETKSTADDPSVAWSSVMKNGCILELMLGLVSGGLVALSAGCECHDGSGGSNCLPLEHHIH